MLPATTVEKSKQLVMDITYATMNDSAIVRFDGEILPLVNDPLFTDYTYELFINPTESTETVTLSGVYGITDNGYFQHPLFIFPTKNSYLSVIP